MHIPSSMLSGVTCPVTMTLGAAGLGAAAYLANKSENKPSVAKFAAVSSLVFALQMLNYPVQDGTSGHLLGGVLAFSLLGAPFAVLSMAVVLTVQCVFFADGGLNALGANIFNMAVIGIGAAGLLQAAAQKILRNKAAAVFAVSWLSVVLAALACSVEVAAAGTVAFAKVLPAMLSTHALIGLGEGAITLLCVYGLFASAKALKFDDKTYALSAFAFAITAAALSPFASSFPDGLEWVAGHLQFKEFAGSTLQSLFAGYQVPGIAPEGASTLLAGLAGIAIVSLISVITALPLKRKV